MTTASPAFQLYAKDALEGCAEMSLAEFGLMWRLVFLSWGKGPLPNNHERLARMAGCTPEEFAACWPAVKPKWRRSDDGLVNARLEAEREKQRIYREKQAENGQRGGRPPKNPTVNPNHNPNKTGGLVLAKPNGNPNESSSSSSSSSSSLSDLQSSSTIPTAKIKTVARSRSLAVTYSPEFETFWQAYPNKTGKGKAWLMFPVAHLAQMLNALSWQVNQPQWTKEGGKYIPHPATWLRQRRWEDEPFHAPIDLSIDHRDSIGIANLKAAARHEQLVNGTARPQPPTRPLALPVRPVRHDPES